MVTDLMNPHIVWAFDLGKGSISEAVRQGTQFLHKAPLLIPLELTENKAGEDCPRRLWLRNAFEPVYPPGG